MPTTKSSALVPEPVMASLGDDGRLTLVVALDGRYYRLENATPEFTPVSPVEGLMRPARFSDELNHVYMQLLQNHTAQPFGYLTLSDTLLLFFLEQLETLEPDEILDFGSADHRARSRSPRQTPDPSDPEQVYRWAKATATAWNRLKQLLGS